ncbi:uncharacterized protein EV154DRAFT_481881 [Mucor mucedo]|uniref:uncharacterized protein n=1 Tax=Mucor mucedo TaxID=29922 RepID=UPI00221FDF05|nr:uncharacterized protein EV154DRAFT_481881 [Mucor mucedo]KAI7890753.1 hypothetical protein EV154DRAFT_481881 [Mucor mucedo]
MLYYLRFDSKKTIRELFTPNYKLPGNSRRVTYKVELLRPICDIWISLQTPVLDILSTVSLLSVFQLNSKIVIILILKQRPVVVGDSVKTCEWDLHVFAMNNNSEIYFSENQFDISKELFCNGEFGHGLDQSTVHELQLLDISIVNTLEQLAGTAMPALPVADNSCTATLPTATKSSSVASADTTTTTVAVVTRKTNKRKASCSVSSETKQKKKQKKEFACPFCDFSCNRKYNLQTHMILHNPHRVKKHQCADCDRGFDRKADLKRHNTNVHKK